MKKYCSLCEENHAIENKEKISTTLKGVEIEYLNISLYCPDMEESYYEGDMLDDNLERCRIAFKEKTGIDFNEYTE